MHKQPSTYNTDQAAYFNGDSSSVFYRGQHYDSLPIDHSVHVEGASRQPQYRTAVGVRSSQSRGYCVGGDEGTWFLP